MTNINKNVACHYRPLLEMLCNHILKLENQN